MTDSTMSRRDAAWQLLRQLDRGSIVVSDTSRSMVPLLLGGETLHWRRWSSRPRFGDLIIYLQSPGPIVHRALWAGRVGVLTKGDGRGGFDQQRVTVEHLLGVVERIERDGRSWELEGGGATLYRWIAAAISLTGGLLFAPAVRIDLWLKSRVGSRSETIWLARPIWWIQSVLQRALHKTLFRSLHRVKEGS